MKTKTSIFIGMLAIMALFLTACGPKTESASDNPTATNSSTESSPASFLLAEVPESVLGVVEALNDTQPGGSLVFTGRIGGVVDPISKEFAAFVIADESLVFCDEMGNDGHCPTPWDACCEDKDKSAASRAFVQFTDPAGNPLQVDLKQVTGLADNDTVIVKGILSTDSTPSNRMIIAEGIAITQ